MNSAGEVLDLRTGKAASDDPSRGADWKASRTVRAEFLRDLLTGERTGADGDPARRFRLRGARIAGNLDLEGAELKQPIDIQDCWFEESVNFSEAQTAGICLSGCHLPSLEARQLRVHGNLVMDAGLHATHVNLHGAQVDGFLNMRGSVLENPQGTTLWGIGLSVGQGMLCGNDFISRGTINLLGSTIAQGLTFTGAKLINESGGWALDAQSIHIGRSLFMGSSYDDLSGFEAKGGLRLVGGRIDGFVCGWGAHIDASQNDGFAIAGMGLQVTESILFDDGFVAVGMIHLPSARVGNEIDLKGAQLSNPGGCAFMAERFTAGDSILFTDGFRAHGTINLTDAQAGGRIDFTGADISDPAVTVTLQGASAKALVFRPKVTTSRLDLRHAKVAVLDDDSAAWPERLFLRDFTYESIDHDNGGFRSRLDWLRRDAEHYIPQPYEQLATVYRQAGHEEAARKVAIAKQCSRRSVLNAPGKIWNWLLFITIGYGYRAWLAGLWIIGFAAIGTVVFSVAHSMHLMVPKNSVTPFNAAIYSLDDLLPVVNLGEQNSWQPLGFALWTSWVLIALGWILTSALVAGLAGIFKRD